MKTVEFVYTDAKGNVSTRALMALITPSNAYEGIDVTGLSIEEYMEFLSKCTKLQEEYIKALQAVQAEYDLTHNYRKFLPERMDNVSIS